MDTFLSALGIGVVVFASTNIDDLLLLSAFFAHPQLRTRNIVLGQFLGIGALIAASLIAALAALVIPAGWTALLGLVPLGLGVRGLLMLRRNPGPRGMAADEAPQLQAQEQRMEQRTHSQVLTVAGVTVANGGDNLGVYIPLFASATGMIPLYVAIFAAMTALWCLLGYLLVHNRLLGQQVRHYGRVVLPFVLLALGLHILSGARVLLH
jgi:cadmium resistance protein CadD (predicted permease)